MKLTVKTLALTTIFLSLVISSSAQLKLPVVNGIGPDIKKVLQDYPNQFHNLMGDVVEQNPQSTDYACNFKVNGAEEVTITQYSSANKYDITSWQALMLTTEDFEDAKKKFKALYNQLQNLAVRIEGGVYFHLKGTYETPVEEKKFTTVVFAVDAGASPFKKLKVELQMIYVPMEWKVKVLVYDKEREDDERGETEEGE
jgi:hypothetical protein